MTDALNLPEPAPEVQRAISTARLWAVGKMIGGDEEEVLAALVGEIDRLRAYATAEVLAEREKASARRSEATKAAEELAEEALGNGNDRYWVDVRLAVIRAALPPPPKESE